MPTLRADEADGEHGYALCGGNLLEEADVVGIVVIRKVHHS